MSKSPKILRTSYVYRPLSRYFHWVCSRESTLTVAQLDSLISWDALPKDLTLLGTYICMQRVLNARKKIWKVLLLTRCRFYGRARRFSIPDFHCGCTHGCNQHLQSFRPPSRYLFWISSDISGTLQGDKSTRGHRFCWLEDEICAVGPDRWRLYLLDATLLLMST